ncbi:MAG TPA: hypothetical protein VHF05_02155 [Candidatus Paceibacterota bacterium]|jgi:hypothetical protein|nr:hypothetical protein [Candidatus Paceibacterota bacterium]
MSNFFKKYLSYLKNNPGHYWFKDKLYGWGWVPATWQGWLVIALYVVILVLLALTIDSNSSRREVAFMFILPVVILTTLLLVIIYKKGERPRWQWGNPPDREEK